MSETIGRKWTVDRIFIKLRSRLFISRPLLWIMLCTKIEITRCQKCNDEHDKYFQHNSATITVRKGGIVETLHRFVKIKVIEKRLQEQERSVVIN